MDFSVICGGKFVSGFIGALGSLGMFFLIGALFFTFLKEIGVICREKAKDILQLSLAVLAVGLVFWLGGGVIHAAVYGPNSTQLTDIPSLFRTKALEKIYACLETPDWCGPFSGLFVYAAHGMGKILFGKYLLAGMLLSLCLTLAGSSLCMERFRDIFGREKAKDALFLLLSFPGSCFLFLPGGASMAFFLLSLLFFYLGKRIPKMKYQGGFAFLLSLNGICSGALLFAVVTGKLL